MLLIQVAANWGVGRGGDESPPPQPPKPPKMTPASVSGTPYVREDSNEEGEATGPPPQLRIASLRRSGGGGGGESGGPPLGVWPPVGNHRLLPENCSDEANEVGRESHCILPTHCCCRFSSLTCSCTTCIDSTYQ